MWHFLPSNCDKILKISHNICPVQINQLVLSDKRVLLYFRKQYENTFLFGSPKMPHISRRSTVTPICFCIFWCVSLPLRTYQVKKKINQEVHYDHTSLINTKYWLTPLCEKCRRIKSLLSIARVLSYFVIRFVVICNTTSCRDL